MSLSEKRKKGTASQMIPSDEHDSKAKIPIQRKRPSSPVDSCVSMKSDMSMDRPVKFTEGDISTEPSPIQQERPASPVPSCVSMKSDMSMDRPVKFRKRDISTKQSPIQQQRSSSPVPSCVSMKSDWSMDRPVKFTEGGISTEQRDQQGRSESEILSGQSVQSHQTDQFSIFNSDEKKEISAKDEKNMNQKELVDTVEKSQTLLRLHQKRKTKLKEMYQMLCEGNGLQENHTFLKDIYTDLYITEGGNRGVHKEHEVRQIEMASKRQTTPETPIKCNDIFKPLKHEDMFSGSASSLHKHESELPLVHLHGHNKHIKRKGMRNLTKGIAGIGKTVSVQKVILDWAEGKANQDVQLIFPLPFRDLNLKKDNICSLMQLLSNYFPELKEVDRIVDNETKILFIFDGLDECRLPLDFINNKKCYDVTEPTSVDVLLTNLIEGNMFPYALLWITTRPAAANHIPSEFVDQVTEIRGFNEPQKEEYFRKKITDQSLADEIINHIKTSRSLHIMCHIPVFCWISATVLESMLTEAEKDEIPKTLTQMYEHFLLIQTCMKNKKYNNYMEINERKLSQSDRDMILKLSKVAFQQLQKGNLIFYEEDLRECGIDVTEASEYSGLCTEIFKEELGFNQEKVFRFVHLSIQEFLAAIHALESCLGKEENVFPLDVNTQSSFQHDDSDDEVRKSDKLSDLYRRAVDQSLRSENGHLDLFLRFLLGLSLESNQNLLCGLLTQTGSTTQSNEETVKGTVEYLSEMIRRESSPERIINLFHCLNELGANSLVEEMKTFLQSGALSESELQPHQCSALAYLLLMSEEVLEEFDIKTYKTSEEGYQRLLPVVKTCKRALLSGSIITEEGCAAMVSALKSNPSHLKELDLSNNLLYDTGVKKLSVCLEDPQCRLETLRLSVCGIPEAGCASLVSALKSNPSHLKVLDLSNNDLKDTSMEKLSALFKDPQCRLETLRLSCCGITEGGCASLVSALESNPSLLKELDLSNNDLKDTGVEKLSALFKDPQCRLETLRLSGCLVTEKGCSSLASALKSNPTHLKELDLSYNNPGDEGLKDLLWIVVKLNVDHGGEWRLKSGMKKYACDLTLDPNTVFKAFSLSEENRKVTREIVTPPSYPEHPERFINYGQVMCKQGLSGRCYWEVEISGGLVEIAVTYKGIPRYGYGKGAIVGCNGKSWRVKMSGNERIGVYLDWPAGTLSFYSVSSDKLTNLYSLKTTFSEPLYPLFKLYDGPITVSLCPL